MNSTIQKALAALQNANYSVYFEEMDKVVPVSLKNPYQEHKSKFISGNYPHNFYQQLEVFAKNLLVEDTTVISSNSGNSLLNKMKKDEIIVLIDKDLDSVFDILDDIFKDGNGAYNDLCKEYISRPNNFDIATFRSKLKRLVKTSL